MLFYITSLLIFTSIVSINSSRKILPKFHWLEGHTSPHGVTILNIKFPDGKPDDEASLRQTSSDPCILKGHLRLESNVSVMMKGGCNMSKSFEISFRSRRLRDSVYQVSNGEVAAKLFDLPRIENTSEIYYYSIRNPKPIHETHFPINGFVLRLKAFYDKSFANKFEDESTFIIEKILKRSQIVFLLPSLGTKIHLQLIGVEEIEESIVANNYSLQLVAQKYTTDNVTNAFVFFADGQNDEEQVEGIALNTGLCSKDQKQRAAIVHWTESFTSTAKILAHEIGHLLGIKHDFTDDDNGERYKRLDRNRLSCSSIQGVMDYSSKRLEWTTCSQQDIEKYYEDQTSGGKKFCLDSQELTLTPGFTKIAVALGTNPQSLDDIEVIDLTSEKSTCQNLPNFPYKNFYSVGGLGYQDRPIICGGRNNRSACLSLENGRWKSVESLREERYRFAMTKSPFPNDGSKLFAAGGRGASRLNSAEVLNKNGWQQSYELPVKIHSHCMVLVSNTSVMVIGGFQDEEDKGYLFNSTSNEWFVKPGLKQPRSGHSCGLVKSSSQSQDKSIIVVGGWDLKNKGLECFTEILDQVSNEWRTGPKLPLALYNSVLVEEPSGSVILIGGSLLNNALNADIYRLQHAGPNATWETLHQKLKTPRDFHTAFFIPDDITNCTLTE